MTLALQGPFDAAYLNAVFGNVYDQRETLLRTSLLLRPGEPLRRTSVLLWDPSEEPSVLLHTHRPKQLCALNVDKDDFHHALKGFKLSACFGLIDVCSSRPKVYTDLLPASVESTATPSKDAAIPFAESHVAYAWAVVHTMTSRYKGRAWQNTEVCAELSKAARAGELQGQSRLTHVQEAT